METIIYISVIFLFCRVYAVHALFPVYKPLVCTCTVWFCLCTLSVEGAFSWSGQLECAKMLGLVDHEKVIFRVLHIIDNIPSDEANPVQLNMKCTLTLHTACLLPCETTTVISESNMKPHTNHVHIMIHIMISIHVRETRSITFMIMITQV